MTASRRWIAALSILCVSLSLLASTGCRRRGARGGGASSAGGEVTGTITFQNATGEALCGIEITQADHHASHDGRVEPGDSVELAIESEAEHLFVTSCDGDGFLHADTISLSGDTYVFRDTAPQSYQARLDYLRQLNRMNTNAPMQDPALQAQMHEQVQQRRRDHRWTDDPSVTLIASDDWAVLRNDLTGIITGRRVAGVVGHRFPDGHCGIQIHTFRQGHDGSSFSGPVRYEGSAGNIAAGCSMVDWMEGGGAPSTGASTGSSGSGGGNCSNTCASANDGECDDGGPDSLYSVCALGTDCADCGPR